jgi:hypothetical protein
MADIGEDAAILFVDTIAHVEMTVSRRDVYVWYGTATALEIFEGTYTGGGENDGENGNGNSNGNGNEPDPPVKDYEFSVVNGGAYGFRLVWNVSSSLALYDIYLNRHDGKGFELVDEQLSLSTSDIWQFPQICNFNFALGENTIKVVSATTTGYWNFEVVEGNFETNMNMHVENNVLRWDLWVWENIDIYIDRHDGRGFLFHGPGGTLPLAAANFTQGTNSVKIIDTLGHLGHRYSYAHGVLTVGAAMDVWNVNVMMLDTMVNGGAPQITSYGWFQWDQNSWTRSVYVNRNGTGFEFVQIASGEINLAELDMLSGTHTIRTVDIVSTVYHNGQLLFGREVTNWTINLTRNSSALNSDITFEGQSIHGISGLFIFIDRHDGKGFVFFDRPWDSTIPISSLCLADGTNTIKFVENVVVNVSGNNVTMNDRVQIWEFEYGGVVDVPTSYNFEIVIDNFIRWNGANTPYRVYIAEGGTLNFEFVGTHSGVSFVPLSELGLATGINVIKVVQQNGVAVYENGVLSMQRKVATAILLVATNGDVTVFG